MITLYIVLSFVLGVVVCVVFYYFVIVPIINSNYKEFNDYIDEINILKSQVNQYYHTIENQRKQLRQLQKAYDKMKESEK